MHRITKEQASILFQNVSTVEQLQEIIKSNSQYWIDPFSICNTIERCYEGTKVNNRPVRVCTFLHDNVPFENSFLIHPDGTVNEYRCR